jgi:hypothetical protein
VTADCGSTTGLLSYFRVLWKRYDCLSLWAGLRARPFLSDACDLPRGCLRGRRRPIFVADQCLATKIHIESVEAGRIASL